MQLRFFLLHPCKSSGTLQGERETSGWSRFSFSRCLSRPSFHRIAKSASPGNYCLTNRKSSAGRYQHAFALGTRPAFPSTPIPSFTVQYVTHIPSAGHQHLQAHRVRRPFLRLMNQLMDIGLWRIFRMWSSNYRTMNVSVS